MKIKQDDKIKKVVGFCLLFSLPVVFMVVAYFNGGTPGGPFPEEETAAPELQPVENRITMEEAAEVEEDTPVDVPNAKEMEDGQQLAQDFIAAFHEFDVKAPTGYLETSAPYMTDRMAEQYADIPKRGAGGVIRETVVEMEVLPSYLQNGNQVWRIGTTGEAETETEKEYTFTEYQVLIIQDGTDWKVDGVTVNGN